MNNGANGTNQLQNNTVNSSNLHPVVGAHPNLQLTGNGHVSGSSSSSTYPAISNLHAGNNAAATATSSYTYPSQYPMAQPQITSTATIYSNQIQASNLNSLINQAPSNSTGSISNPAIPPAPAPPYNGIRVRGNLYNYNTNPPATALPQQTHSLGVVPSSSSNAGPSSSLTIPAGASTSTANSTAFTVQINGRTIRVKRSARNDLPDPATSPKKPRGRPKKVKMPPTNLPLPATVTSSNGLAALRKQNVKLWVSALINSTTPSIPNPMTSSIPNSMTTSIPNSMTTSMPNSMAYFMPQNMPLTSHAMSSSTSLAYIPPIHSPPIVTAAIPQPPNWLDRIDDTVMSLNTYKKYAIDKDTAEYQTISDMVYPIQVTRIEQIVNHELWDRFVKTRADMLKSKADDDTILRKLGLNDRDLARRLHASFNFTKDPLLIPYSDNMVLLFHCTRSQANVKSILTQGLDERLSNASGGLLGKGIYFSDDPNKSLQYDGTQSIFIFAVLLGDCISVDHIHNKNAFVREPEKVNQQKRNYNDQFFDSIVARPAGHNEYVIYNRYQCCPLYQIKYNRSASVLTTQQPSHYNLASQKLPPLAWIPTATNYAMPIQDQTTNWPFFSVDIFNTMGVRPPTDDDDYNSVPAIGDDNAQSQPTFDDNLATLINLGYDNEAKNREILTKFGNDLQQTVNYFLDNEDEEPEIVFTDNPTLPTVKDEQPSIIVIDDDDDDDSETHEKLESPPNAMTTTITNDSTPCKDESNSETDLPEEIAEWALELELMTSERQDSTVEPPQIKVESVEQQIEEPTIEPQTEDCPICCNDYESFDTDPSSWHVLQCSHRLCISCYSKLLTTRFTMSRVQHTFVKCPFCQGTSGIEIGTCPDMDMNVTVNPASCDGYSPSSTFVINYTGQNFHRTAYIPSTVEGQEALRRLKTAFDRRLCFTIGTSNTTGHNNVIVWNIHHKTALSGGVVTHGYPDPEYLDRLKWELRAFGIE